MTGQSPTLSPGEKAVARKLFAGSKTRIDLEPRNHEALQSAKKALQKALRTEFEKVYFVRNTRYFAPGIGLTVLALLLLVVVSDEPAITAFVSVWLTMWTGVVYFLVRRIWSGWRAALSGDGSITRVEAILSTLFSLPFLGGEVMGLAFYAETTSVGAAVLVSLIQLLNLLFYHLLKAPTRLGRDAMDAIAGFKDYLSIAEKDRMNMLNPPERTPQLFERFLPYALALEVEQQWAEQFSNILAQVGADSGSGGRAYTPRWYSGGSLSDGFGGFASTMGSGFAGAASSASTAPGSSSGSGGGGSSGGGGGGGGGGGW